MYLCTLPHLHTPQDKVVTRGVGWGWACPTPLRVPTVCLCQYVLTHEVSCGCTLLRVLSVQAIAFSATSKYSIHKVPLFVPPLLQEALHELATQEEQTEGGEKVDGDVEMEEAAAGQASKDDTPSIAK